MSKIMVVEDDASLREIYSIRITAEGYDVVSACDGEEALAVAVREKPALILSDIMMPKISGFDMLDILRSTPETADIKVVMMTALSADDQRARGERLGADRYLVKSQVGIEDVINVIHEVLGDKPSSNASSPDMSNQTSLDSSFQQSNPINPNPITSPLQPQPAPAGTNADGMAQFSTPLPSQPSPSMIQSTSPEAQPSVIPPTPESSQVN